MQSYIPFLGQVAEQTSQSPRRFTNRGTPYTSGWMPSLRKSNLISPTQQGNQKGNKTISVEVLSAGRETAPKVSVVLDKQMALTNE